MSNTDHIRCLNFSFGCTSKLVLKDIALFAYLFTWHVRPPVLAFGSLDTVSEKASPSTKSTMLRREPYLSEKVQVQVGDSLSPGSLPPRLISSESLHPSRLNSTRPDSTRHDPPRLVLPPRASPHLTTPRLFRVQSRRVQRRRVIA